MFRDASEELERLQAELLAEEESAEEDSQESPEEEEAYEAYEDYEQYDEPDTYQNYANGYHVYNSDTSDEDLDEYSEDVRSGDKSRGGCCLAVIACLLCLMLAGVVLFITYVKGYLK